MASEPLIKICDRVFGANKLAVFCGAGISKNSGLPLAAELKRSILKELLTNESEVDEIVRVRLPFEAFIQSVFDPQIVSDKNTHVGQILDLFGRGEPNSNHRCIARLAKAGYLNTIATTNFDLLFERAFEKEGLVDGVDFQRCYTEDDFSSIDFDKLGQRLILLKLHGSIDHPDSVRATLDAVFKKQPGEKRFNIVKYLFSTGKHEAVLILGYSCSDVFDIVPQIQRLEGGRKQIFYIEHSPDRSVDLCRNISEIKNRNLFRRFSGKWIECDTDLFIKGIWKLLEESIGVYEPVTSDLKWTTYVEGWLGDAEIDVRKKSFIAARIFGRIGLLDKALNYCERARALALTADDLEALMPTSHEMGTIYQRLYEKKGGLANLNKAVRCYKEALETARVINAEFSVAECAHSLGIVYTWLARFRPAIDCISYACYIYADQKYQVGIADSLSALGVAYYQRALTGNPHRQQDMDKALKNYRKSLKLCGKLKHALGAGVAYCNIGNVYEQKKNFPEAIKFYKRAEKKFEDLGDIIYLIRIYENLVHGYEQIKDINNLEKYQNKLKNLNQIDGLDLLYI